MLPPSFAIPRRVPLTRIGLGLWGSYRALDKLSVDVPAEVLLGTQCRRRQCSSCLLVVALNLL